MDQSLPDLVRDSQLEVTVLRDHTTQIVFVSNAATGQRRARTEEKWQRTQQLGRGSFGVVWLEKCASGPSVGQVRAVKQIWKEPGGSDLTHKAPGGYYRELEAIAKFSQEKYRDHFVRSSGWFENDDAVFIAMEYLPLGDLENWMTRALGEAEACHIVRQLLEGVEFMHSHQFAHRDLKPKNVLVLHAGPNWWVKIADFGISKRTEQTALRTRIGTDMYLAPEVRGIYAADLEPEDEHTFSLAVDIWSVGAMTFQMATGRHAFPEARGLFDYVVRGRSFPTDDGLSAECVSFLKASMAASPRARPTSPKALGHEWLVLAPASTAAETSVSLPHLSDPDATVTLDLASARWSTLDQDLEQPEPRYPLASGGKISAPELASAQRRTPAEGSRPISTDPLTTGTTLDEIASDDSPEDIPSSGTLSKLFEEPSKSAADLDLGPDTETDPVSDPLSVVTIQKLTAHTGKINAVAFSPSGAHIASGGDDKEVRIWDLNKGRARNGYSLPGHTRRVISVKFSHDSRILFSASIDNTIKLWKMKGKRFELNQTLKSHTHWINSLALSSDGLLASGGGDKTVRIHKAVANGVFVLAQTISCQAIVLSVALSTQGSKLAITYRSEPIEIWGLSDDKFVHLQTLQGHLASVETSLFTTNNRLVTGSGYGEVIIWSDDTGRFERDEVLRDHLEKIRLVATLPNGRLVSAGCRKIKLWKRTSGSFHNSNTMDAHDDFISCAASSSNGRLLASGSHDKTLRIWSIMSREEIYSM